MMTTLKYDGLILVMQPPLLSHINQQQGQLLWAVTQPGLFFGKGSVRDRDLADGDFGSCLFNLGTDCHGTSWELPTVPINYPP